MALELRSQTRKQLVTDKLVLDYDELDVSGTIVRYVPTSPQSEARINTLLEKEPLTVPWLATFKPDEVYLDVGANVGMYAVFAGAAGARVFAFEPEALNYAELNKNIFINGLHGRMTAYCMAISDVRDVSVLFLSSFTIAGSHNDFGENRWTGDKQIGEKLVARDARPQQGCVSYPIDELVADGMIPPPNHIKIDVDGIEHKVITGAEKTLRSEQLRSVLLEVDFTIPESVALVDKMTAMGWRYSEDQVRLNQHVIMKPGKIASLMARGKAGANFIFYKDSFYDAFFADFVKTFVPPNPLPAPAKAPAI